MKYWILIGLLFLSSCYRNPYYDYARIPCDRDNCGKTTKVNERYTKNKAAGKP